MSAKSSSLALVLLGAIAATGCAPDGPSRPLPLPERSPSAPTATRIVEAIDTLALPRREAVLVDQILSGNVPSGLRELRPVEIVGAADGVERRIVLWVMPDYLAVGSDDDALRIPLSPGRAQEIADSLRMTLPTPAIVDAIWRAASVRLSPVRIDPDSLMRSVGRYQRHDRIISAQALQRRLEPDVFLAGHKKDVVLSSRLTELPGRVAIYGWHGTSGQPSQELSTVLPDTLVDYSHGIRLVDRRVEVDGVERDLAELLADPAWSPLLTGESSGIARYPDSAGTRSRDRR